MKQIEIDELALAWMRPCGNTATDSVESILRYPYRGTYSYDYRKEATRC